jgi:hypothetical protein
MMTSRVGFVVPHPFGFQNKAFPTNALFTPSECRVSPCLGFFAPWIGVVQCSGGQAQAELGRGVDLGADGTSRFSWD